MKQAVLEYIAVSVFHQDAPHAVAKPSGTGSGDSRALNVFQNG
jgi:hypothetical protein